ncbi:hypothetical protein FRC03_004661 [Tulasnella sp. 419]|nr:hypothetical protein FRC03_004661 [Tulasnella sp. 419]
MRPTPTLHLLLMGLIAPTPPLPQPRRHPLPPSLGPNLREGTQANHPKLNSYIHQHQLRRQRRRDPSGGGSRSAWRSKAKVFG